MRGVFSALMPGDRTRGDIGAGERPKLLFGEPGGNDHTMSIFFFKKMFLSLKRAGDVWDSVSTSEL